jgi:hypothetical protein
MDISTIRLDIVDVMLDDKEQSLNSFGGMFQPRAT